MIKKILLILFAVNCSLLIVNSQWVQVSNGIENRLIHSLTFNGNNMFAGTNLYGVYFSTNNGMSWGQTSLNNQSVWAVAANGNYTFAGTYDFPPPYHGVYRSSNNGINWDTTSLVALPVQALIVNNNYILAGLYDLGGVYKSTDNGSTWVQSLSNLSVWTLAAGGNYIFAGCFGAMGVFRSSNNGLNWNQTLSNIYIGSLAVNGNNVFAGNIFDNPPRGVYLSTDNGASWAQTSLNNQAVGSLTVNGNFIFAGTSSYGVYISNDNGSNWTQWNDGMGNQTVNTFCIFNNYIFAGTQTNGIYRRPLSDLTGIKKVSIEIPNEFSLSQNYPNPFNPETKIKFAVPSAGNGRECSVQIIIYDVLGREVALLVNKELKPGIYEIYFDAAGYSCGVYFYRLITADFTDAKRMVLLK